MKLVFSLKKCVKCDLLSADESQESSKVFSYFLDVVRAYQIIVASSFITCTVHLASLKVVHLYLFIVIISHIGHLLSKPGTES